MHLMYGFIEMIHGDTLKTLVVIQSIYISVTTILYENLKKTLDSARPQATTLSVLTQPQKTDYYMTDWLMAGMDAGLDVNFTG